jgi:tripartite ATP-independent transporter DctM subunit
MYTAWRAKVPRTAFAAGPVFSSARALSWEAGIPVILLLGVLSGLAGIDESAALGLAWVGFVALKVHKDLKREQLKEIAGEAIALAGAVVLILMMANALMNWIIDQQLPGKVLESLMGMGLKERWHLLVVINVFLLVVGMVMEGFSAILVTVPLVVPLAARFGFDPFHLAVMFLLNLELAFLMPPLGLNLFISAFRFQRPLGEVYRATLPFVGVVGATLLLVIAVPWLSNEAVQPAIAKARANAERLGIPPTDAWALECVQEDTTHPHACTEEEKKKYAVPVDEGEDDDLMKQMMEGG